MCSVSNQSPVQLRLAFEPTGPSHTNLESFLQQPRLKMAPPLIKTKRHSHKSLRSVEPTIVTSQKDNQKSSAVQANVSNGHSKKSTKLRPKHAVSTSSSLDTSVINHNESVDHAENESFCRNSLVSPPRKYKHCKSSSYRLPTDTDELLRKVSVQLMRAQNGDVSRKCDKTKNSSDGQKSITLSSVESPKLSVDNDMSPTSDDCGQFSGASTPDQQGSGNGTCTVIDEDQLRMACELIIEQQRKAWVAFKKAKKSGHGSLTRPVDKKESPSSNISNEMINVRCKNETISMKVNNANEEGNTSSEQFDSGHGSSEEHEIISKTERLSSAGNTNLLLPTNRSYYHIRRQKGHSLGLKVQNTSNKITDSVPSPLGVEMRTIKTNPTEHKASSRNNNAEFKPSSCIARHSRSTALNTELLEERNCTTSSQSPSYLSTHICSGHASSASSSSSSLADIHQLTASCCRPESQEHACTVLVPTEKRLLNCGSIEGSSKSPKRTVKPSVEINVTSSSSSTMESSLSHTSKTSSKKENNKGNVKLYSTLTRGCMSCGFFTSACSKIGQIRRTISGKASSVLPSTRSPRE